MYQQVVGRTVRKRMGFSSLRVKRSIVILHLLKCRELNVFGYRRRTRWRTVRRIAGASLVIAPVARLGQLMLQVRKQISGDATQSISRKAQDCCRDGLDRGRRASIAIRFWTGATRTTQTSRRSIVLAVVPLVARAPGGKQCRQEQASAKRDCHHCPGPLLELTAPVKGRFDFLLELVEILGQIIASAIYLPFYLICSFAHCTFSFTV